MNIALGTLIWLLLILPGVLFRVFLIKSESFENPLDTSKIAELTFMIIPSLLLHYLAITYYLPHSDYLLELKQLYYLIVGDTKGTILDFKNVIEPSFPLFLKYIFVQCLIGMGIGYIFKRIILFFDLDLRLSNVFAISNEWDNLLSSRQYVYEEKLIIKKDIRSTIWRFLKRHFKFKNFVRRLYLLILYYRNLKTGTVVVDILVSISGKSILYEGILHKFYLSKGNSLDKVYLTDVFKKEFMSDNIDKDDDDDDDEGFQEINSDVLVIKGEDIVNLNVIYFFYID